MNKIIESVEKDKENYNMAVHEKISSVKKKVEKARNGGEKRKFPRVALLPKHRAKEALT